MHTEIKPAKRKISSRLVRLFLSILQYFLSVKVAYFRCRSVRSLVLLDSHIVLILNFFLNSTLQILGLPLYLPFDEILVRYILIIELNLHLPLLV